MHLLNAIPAVGEMAVECQLQRELWDVLCVQDILTKFNGSWALSPIRDEAGNATGRTYAVLEQDILPAGLCPPLSTPLNSTC